MNDQPPNYNDITSDPTVSIRLDQSSSKHLLSFDDFGETVKDSEIATGKEWPPTRFKDRQRFFDTLHLISRNGYPADIDLGITPVTVNTFKSYAIRLASLLLMSEPLLEGQEIEGTDDSLALVGQENPLLDIAYDGLFNMVKYGGTVLVRYGDGVINENPASWYPGNEEGKHYIVNLLTDPKQPNSDEGHNVAAVTTIGPEGAMVESYSWANNGIGVGQFGKQLMVQELEDVAIQIVPRLPREGLWGESKFVLMYSATLEINRIYSNNSSIFSIYSGPKGIIQASDSDVLRFSGVNPDDDTKVQEKKKRSWLSRLFKGNTIAVPDSVMGLQFLQPNVQGATYALAQASDLREHLRDVTGLPDLTGQTVSGDALKRLYVHFYAETAALQLSLRKALERLLGTAIEWPHIFDSDIFATEITEPPTQPAGEEADNGDNA